MKGPIRILYLDDEEQNLHSFQAMFRREFEVFTTVAPSEAVKILAQQDIHIVFSDQKMPELSGVEFFEMIQSDFPEPIRILLTGYADIEAVIDAINKGQVYRYLTKPWNENELRITIEDAYEMMLARREVTQKTIALEKAYTELEKFVYSASHDLRAPLVSIKGIIKLARAENNAAKVPEYLDMIDRSVLKLDSFVQNIIHYYQNNRREEIISLVNLAQMTDDTIEHLRHYEGASRIQFNNLVDKSIQLQMDELRMKVVLNNLVSNAVKYANPGQDIPTVTIEGRKSAGRTIIKVSDNGLGIEEENLPKIFDMFFRSSTKQIGTGIGLYIVREAVDKLGGKINVSSRLKEGTTFTIEIPDRV